MVYYPFDIVILTYMSLYVWCVSAPWRCLFTSFTDIICIFNENMCLWWRDDDNKHVSSQVVWIGSLLHGCVWMRWETCWSEQEWWWYVLSMRMPVRVLWISHVNWLWMWCVYDFPINFYWIWLISIPSIIHVLLAMCVIDAVFPTSMELEIIHHRWNDKQTRKNTSAHFEFLTDSPSYHKFDTFVSDFVARAEQARRHHS